MLVLAAKLQQVVAFQPGNVVAEEMILPIPEPRACLLGVDVVGSGYVVPLLAERFECGAQS